MIWEYYQDNIQAIHQNINQSTNRIVEKIEDLSSVVLQGFESLHNEVFQKLSFAAMSGNDNFQAQSAEETMLIIKHSLMQLQQDMASMKKEGNIATKEDLEVFTKQMQNCLSKSLQKNNREFSTKFETIQQSIANMSSHSDFNTSHVIQLVNKLVGDIPGQLDTLMKKNGGIARIAERSS